MIVEHAIVVGVIVGNMLVGVIVGDMIVGV